MYLGSAKRIINARIYSNSFTTGNFPVNCLIGGGADGNSAAITAAPSPSCCQRSSRGPDPDDSDVTSTNKTCSNLFVGSGNTQPSDGSWSAISAHCSFGNSVTLAAKSNGSKLREAGLFTGLDS